MMERIEGYQVFAELKNGPVTTVFKAVDARYNQVVLIKLLRPEAAAQEHWRTQFLQESRISAKIAHPNLRRTLHAGALDGQPYIVLEYIEGPTLHELTKQHKRLPLDLCIYLAKELAAAIGAVHQNKVLHRDIKPQNIFLAMNGAVKLGDLGSAHELADNNPLTIGTPAYMSPEYILGQEVGPASDLFSLGAVLYEMLTGEVAFVNRTLAATLLHVVNWDPVPIAKLRPETPPELIVTCQKLLAKNPAQRYRSAAAVSDDLGFLEKKYGLTTNRNHLAYFLESPDTYFQVVLQSNAILSPATGAPAPSPRRIPTLSWGVAAIMSASMFLAGVLFIKGLKEYYFDDRNAARSAKTAMALPGSNAAETGYLDLRVIPWGTVFLNGDSTGTTPLPAAVPLPTGRNEVKIRHPRWGERVKEVGITPGDTARLTIDLTQP
ncbi:MAG: Serine/threonine-protein kinase PknD [bacterium]|nr:Serine/threonine-protein kinase PknD [bacterium]